MIFFRRLSAYLERLFFPKVCPCPDCGVLLTQSGALACVRCLGRLKRTTYYRDPLNPVCLYLDKKVPLYQAFSLFLFEKNQPIQHFLHTMKYGKNPEWSVFFGNQIAEVLTLENCIIKNVDYIIPVPLHPKREKNRGFNQSAVIGAQISSRCGIPMADKALIRVKKTKTQAALHHYQDRILNLHNVFQCVPQERLRHKHLLVVDDVLTTGATLVMAMRELCRIEGVRISVVTVACATQFE